MNRPYLNDSIIKLEASFEEHKKDLDHLRLLDEELSFRSTERAKKLKVLVLQQLQLSVPDSKSEIIQPAFEQFPQMAVKSLTDYQKFSVEPGKDVIPKNDPKDILAAWIALEVLSPQTFRKEKDLAGSYGSIVHFDDSPLPWEGDGERSKPNYRLYYQIVLGTLDFGKAISALLSLFGDKREERPSAVGEAILATILVDKKGLLVDEQCLGLSSFAWGVPQALKGDLRKLSQWTEAENTLNQALDKILRRTNEAGENVPLTKGVLANAANYLISVLELPKEFVTGNSFAIRTYQYFTSKEDPEPLLLNSFFIGDLITAEGLFKQNKATSNLAYYVGEKQPKVRKDLLHDLEALEHALRPSLIPPARWPGPGRHPLVALQQAAVNGVFEELITDGILAVNGPPGTGKTTLLRDIVAGVVMLRAEAMCEFEDPAQAFTNSGKRVSAGPAFWTLYELESSLKGFELLIASSNNKAVENVSAELPGLKAIADDATDLRYFSCTSDALLEKESWGLIAAVLGNAGNRAKFRQGFWWDKEVGLSTYLAECAGTPQFVDEKDPITGQVISQRKPKVISEEQAPTPLAAKERWKIARSEFRVILEKGRSKLAELERIRQVVIYEKNLVDKEKAANNALKVALSDEIIAKSNVDSTRMAYAVLADQASQAEERLSGHKKTRPGFFARLFGTSAARAWKQEYNLLLSLFNTARKELEFSAELVAQHTAILEKAVQVIKGHRNMLKNLVENLVVTRREIENARAQIGDHLIDSQFFSASHEKQQMVSPWCDKSVQKTRDDIFVSAVKLHKAFIDAAARPIRHNIAVLMTIFSGGTLPDEEKQKLLSDLWSTLFLLVPAVSTTFASIERMLGKLPPESLGWLLIDEAGQALPQAAVGAIMRTKRAVIVGDPLQIEPVVTLPDSMTHSICRQFGVDPNRFNAPEASTQTLADAATSYYAEFEGKLGTRSVGVPLLVHRRCEDPMFSISNSIAYERLMVQAKVPKVSRVRDLMGPSRWIDIQGQAKEKWCPEEGVMVLDILQRLKKAGIPPDLYIVTPFVIVADNLRRLVRDSGLLNSWVDNEIMWPYERIGTVHTVQGREAEAVIFVLGAASPQQAGARGWAGGRPNLLNVAVTRAKEVLYVVGNRQLWKSAGLFRDLSERLPSPSI